MNIRKKGIFIIMGLLGNLGIVKGSVIGLKKGDAINLDGYGSYEPRVLIWVFWPQRLNSSKGRLHEYG